MKMKFLLPLAVMCAVATAFHYSTAERPVEFLEAMDLAVEFGAGEGVKTRIENCNNVAHGHCKHFLKRAIVKGNTNEERYRDLLEAINSVEVKDFIKEIDSVTNPPEAVTDDPEGDN
ncbi:hypothetical protein PRIPAC_72719 [Pristionchus pacificus]|nr:hypothetical protein PRIPAC_72719 [Pristionchus pacificus]